MKRFLATVLTFSMVMAMTAGVSAQEMDATVMVDAIAATGAGTAVAVTEEVEAVEVVEAEPVVVASVDALVSVATVMVDGEEVAFDAYNIDGNNYFKLRDVAQAVTGTDKQFDVAWDSEAKVIDLLSATAYTTVGGELEAGDGMDKMATETTSPIFQDGEEVALMAYKIGNNNYFKLRDLGMAFDFGIGWDNENDVITVDTTVGYEMEEMTEVVAASAAGTTVALEDAEM